MTITRRNAKVVAVTCLITVAAGVGILYALGAIAESPNFGDMAKGFGGRENVDLVRHTTKVEVFRVRGDARWRRTPDPAVPTALGFPITAGPVTLDRAAARRLAAATTDPDAYEYDIALACIFDPGYVARFTTGDTVTEVAFCFNCGQIAVSRGRGLTMGAGRDRLHNELEAAFAAAPQ